MMPSGPHLTNGQVWPPSMDSATLIGCILPFGQMLSLSHSHFPLEHRRHRQREPLAINASAAHTALKGREGPRACCC